jgi:hypothetical protein
LVPCRPLIQRQSLVKGPQNPGAPNPMKWRGVHQRMPMSCPKTYHCKNWGKFT